MPRLENVALKISISDSDSRVGKILSHSLSEKGHVVIEKLDNESDIVIHNLERNEFNLRGNESIDAFDEVNHEGTKALCEAIDKWMVKPKALIYFSSVSVYGCNEGELINENYHLNGTTPYAISKILAEDFLIEWAYKNKVCLCILRLPEILAGNDSPGYLGEMIRTIRSGKYIRIGNSNFKKSALWIEDIVTLIPKIPAIEGIYNLTDGYHPSLRELEAVIASSLHKKLPFRIPYLIAKSLALIGDISGNLVPLNSKKLKEITSSLTFDDQKARKAFDWKSSNVLEKLAKRF
jgi:nucleoside-diphosphate-sugar epimerase